MTDIGVQTVYEFSSVDDLANVHYLTCCVIQSTARQCATGRVR
jgi:hypothetical protein